MLQVWNAFKDSTEKQPVEYKLEDRDRAPVLYDLNDNRSLGSGVYEVLLWHFWCKLFSSWAYLHNL